MLKSCVRKKERCERSKKICGMGLPAAKFAGSGCFCAVSHAGSALWGLSVCGWRQMGGLAEFPHSAGKPRVPSGGPEYGRIYAGVHSAAADAFFAAGFGAQASLGRAAAAQRVSAAYGGSGGLCGAGVEALFPSEWAAERGAPKPWPAGRELDGLRGLLLGADHQLSLEKSGLYRGALDGCAGSDSRKYL